MTSNLDEGLAGWLFHAGTGLVGAGGNVAGVAQGTQNFLAARAARQAALAQQQRFDAGLAQEQAALQARTDQSQAELGLRQKMFDQDTIQFGEKMSFDKQVSADRIALERRQLAQALETANRNRAGALEIAKIGAGGGSGAYQFESLSDEGGAPITKRTQTKSGLVDYVLPNGQITTIAPEGIRTQSVNNSWLKADVTPQKQILEAGYQAQTALPQIKGALQIMEKNPELYQGTAGSSVQAWRNLAAAWNPEAAKNAADAETLRSVYIQGVLNLLSQTKGAISNQEMDTFQRAAASLDKTPESNKRLLQMSQTMLEKSIKYADFMATRGPQLGYGRAREMWSSQNPIEANTGTSYTADEVSDALSKYAPK